MSEVRRRPHHILIYGPPAAGKLTVARSLVEGHGVKLLDNHLTLDVALQLFPFGTKEVRRMFEMYDLTTRIHDGDFSIDNSEIPPGDVAAIIAAEAGLDPVVLQEGM